MKKIYFLCFFLMLSHIKIISQSNYRDSLRHNLASAKEDANKVETLFFLSNSYLFTYADTSAAYAKQGLQLAQKIDYVPGEVSCMNMLCVSLANLGNFPSSLDFGFKGLALAENLHDTRLIIFSNVALMNCYRKQEDYKEALIFGYKAKSLFTTPYSDTNQVSVVFFILGSIYEKIDQPDSALFYAEKSYQLSKESSEIFQVLGEIHARLKHTDLALNYYRGGISVATQNSTYTGLIDIYNDMSKVFESIGKIDSSIYYGHKSIVQEGIHAYPEGVLRASTQLADLYESKGIVDSTMKYQKLTSALKDSLFSRQKTREAQNFTFNEKLHEQELTDQQRDIENKIKMYALLAVIIIFSVIAFFLWRNNRHKQKAKTKIEKAYSELKSAQAQLIQSEKMASLGELTAGIAHEIQNPLNFVNNFSEVNTELIDELEQEAEKGNIDEVRLIAKDIKENSGKINHHGKRADAIVKGMLQHSRTNSSTKEPKDINKLADEYLRLAYHGLRAKDKSFNADFQTDFDESIGKINIISQDIGRVLLNLYNNAFYTVNEKKKNATDDYQPAVLVQTKKLNGRIDISVSDNGNGISQKILDKVFQPFFTTKPTGQGTGLGLSLSYDIIKTHGGEIKVETKEGEGSKFIITVQRFK